MKQPAFYKDYKTNKKTLYWPDRVNAKSTLEEIATATLEAAKLIKIEEIANQFQLAPSKGCVTSLGFKMDCDRPDISNMQNLVAYLTAANAPGAIIRDHDNQFHSVTMAQLNQIVMELIANGLQLYQKKWAAEQAIVAATTVEAVEAVTL